MRCTCTPILVSYCNGRRILLKVELAALLSGHWLVVDDAEINRLSNERQLKFLGATADLVNDGFEALAALEDGPPYVAVLMDGQMPNLDGYETARRIRAREAETGHAPRLIFLLSGDENAAERALEVGMNGGFQKPIEDKLRPFLESFVASQ